MFIKKLKKKKSRNSFNNPLNGTCTTSGFALKTDEKSLYYENIVQSISLIELEKEMQSGLELFI